MLEGYKNEAQRMELAMGIYISYRKLLDKYEYYIFNRNQVRVTLSWSSTVHIHMYDNFIGCIAKNTQKS